MTFAPKLNREKALICIFFSFNLMLLFTQRVLAQNTFNRPLQPLQQNNIGGIINKYAAVLAYDKCNNSFTVDDASGLNIGDTILIIQMKGAKIDLSNSANFGDITSIGNAGSYEFNYIKAISANDISLLNTLSNQYDIPDGKVQMIRVPYYKSVNITSQLTCLPWDGNKGGVLVLNTQDTIELNANINVTGKGYWGGKVKNTSLNLLDCFYTDYYYDASSIHAAPKGESYAYISSNYSYGRGKAASGGGGGNAHNSGGGGGANGGTGGMGGYQLQGCQNAPFDNRGVGGLAASNTNNKVFMGSGGGAGHCNNNFLNPSVTLDFSGGNGGGIAMLISKYFKSNNYSIIANGDTAVNSNVTGDEAHDARGGGGAGGTILLAVNNFIDNAKANAVGGKGGDIPLRASIDNLGPGGGGGGGTVWITQSTKPSTVNINTSGGENGKFLSHDDAWGAGPGQNGKTLFNLALAISKTPYPFIDSVKIDTSSISCGTGYNFTGRSFPNSSYVTSWQWNFGDNSSAATQNSTHNYATPGNKTVTLTVTNSDGCSAKDIISVTANSKAQITKINDQAICHDKTIQLWVNGGLNYKWAPDNTLSNLNISNPVASPTKNTKYYVTITDANLCTYNDSVEIKVIPTPTFTVNSDTTLCPNTKLQLNATGGDSYLWSPASGVDNPTSATPYISAIQTATVYSVKIKTTQCNDSALLQTKVNISKDIKLSVSKSNDIDCKTGTATLKVTGADTYTWSPNSFIDNTEGSTTVCYPATTTKYYVKGTNADGCEGLDSVTVVVDFSDGEKTKYIPNAFSPNGDGLNDCFGVKRWGYAKVFRLTVYNRWGARVFYTEDPAKCWDGMYKGKQAEAGNYVTEVYAETNCGIVKMKGNLVLIR